MRRTRSGLYAPIPSGEGRQLVAVDLFAGAGGFSLGFHQAGYHVAAAVEWDVAAALTYLMNLARNDVEVHFDAGDPRWARKRGKGSKVSWLGVQDPAADVRSRIGTGWIANQPPGHPGCEHFWIQDIRTLSGHDILRELHMEVGEVDVVFGGPPCQGFSKAGRQDVMDPRNSYVFDFARIVVDLQPKAFVMENVPGMLEMVTPEGIPVVDALSHVLADGGMGTYAAVKDMLLAQQDMVGGVAAVPRGPNSRDPQHGDESGTRVRSRKSSEAELGLPGLF